MLEKLATRDYSSLDRKDTKQIKEVIAQEGNNLYKEGRKKGQEKRRVH